MRTSSENKQQHSSQMPIQLTWRERKCNRKNNLWVQLKCQVWSKNRYIWSRGAPETHLTGLKEMSHRMTTRTNRTTGNTNGCVSRHTSEPPCQPYLAAGHGDSKCAFWCSSLTDAFTHSHTHIHKHALLCTALSLSLSLTHIAPCSSPAHLYAVTMTIGSGLLASSLSSSSLDVEKWRGWERDVE